MTPLSDDADPAVKQDYADRKWLNEEGEINGLSKRLDLGKQT
jgi:hypothetical protein